MPEKFFHFFDLSEGQARPLFDYYKVKFALKERPSIMLADNDEGLVLYYDYDNHILKLEAKLPEITNEQREKFILRLQK